MEKLCVALKAHQDGLTQLQSKPQTMICYPCLRSQLNLSIPKAVVLPAVAELMRAPPEKLDSDIKTSKPALGGAWRKEERLLAYSAWLNRMAE
jgi:hypothetical protein